ncbi:MAG: Asp-tRNA(Asn)/Glu-tRNA(Gln) amidotransferase subunit GatC [Pseudomonadota bacterium]|jgi:aspartyl-tRNA(Asn)/glutamyl-tRNA(Gln) amidotransferase subunit C
MLHQRRDNTLSPANTLAGVARFTPGCNSIFTMSLTASDLSRIANLARLELQPAQSGRILDQLNGFFGMVEKMRAVDTTHIEPLAHPVAAISDISLRLCDDVVSEPASRATNQRSAPVVENGLFLVPRVIE